MDRVSLRARRIGNSVWETTHILVAVHAHTLKLHETGVIIALNQITRLLEHLLVNHLIHLLLGRHFEERLRVLKKYVAKIKSLESPSKQSNIYESIEEWVSNLKVLSPKKSSPARRNIPFRSAWRGFGGAYAADSAIFLSTLYLYI